jgi:hypothetical protein
MLASHIDGMLQADQEQYETLLEAKAKPWVLDDATVNRVRTVFTTAKNDLPLFDEQLRRWRSGPLTTAQQQELDRLAAQMEQVHTVVTAILTLAEELAQGTIEKQLAKSDPELGLEVLLNPDLLRRRPRS